MARNPLQELGRQGQSVWCDFIQRSLVTSGELERLVGRDGVRGVTSNPAIFEKAIAGSRDYDGDIERLAAGVDLAAGDIYERLAIDDIQRAADVLRPVHEETEGRDGYVSLEVSPHLAHETEPTIAEARRLWTAVGRPNVMIKVPGTAAGLPAVRRLTGEGINVNVTLLFSCEVYEAVADAYIGGLEQLAAAGGDVRRVASVASFFVSRIDTLVDQLIERRLAAVTDAAERRALEELRGRVAIANAKLAYASYGRIFRGSRWDALAARGARTQRLLWASTSTKNPAYPPTVYVDELIGPDTVNTVPVATLEEFRRAGRVRPSLAEDPEGARDLMGRLAAAGISIEEVTATLVEQGVELFADAFDKLLAAIERKRRTLLGARLDAQRHAVGPHADALAATLEEWRRGGKVRRLWSRDAKLWTAHDEARWLGWLSLPAEQPARLGELARVADAIRRDGFRHAVLLGMGGSSLCPEVLRHTCAAPEGYPRLVVLDSTVPAQIRNVERSLDLARTLFIVSSKSGTTTETTMLERHFWRRVAAAVGTDRAGGHFVAITDPGSALEHAAREKGFRDVLAGVPSVGGRFSALSAFGMAPAAIAGFDVAGMLREAARMMHSCAASVPPAENPGVLLGAILGTLARAGRDKVTFIVSPGIAALGAWLEQLLAESTGKGGTGLVPVAGERVGPVEAYGGDRLFVHLRLAGGAAHGEDAAVAAVEAAGHPVVRIAVESPIDLGEEFFRWEMATAVAGALLGINPFDQPDVEAAKAATRELTAAYERSGALPPEAPRLDAGGGVRVFADDRNATALGLDRARGLDAALGALFLTLRPGDYFAVNAYLSMEPEHDARLQAIRHAVRDTRRVATTLGYGPRFLHSTGQLHKGGSDTGVFLQITAEDADDLPIPGERFTFGVLKDAQARGDLAVLAARRRRLLHVRLGTDVAAGLDRLAAASRAALGRG
jgi:transaldolase/glucose-6-phosphate isomerase